MASGRSRHLVDPELLGLLNSFGTAVLTPETLPAVREAARRPPPSFQPGDTAVDTQVRTATGPADAPDVTVMMHRPRGLRGPLPCVLHMHGGGFIAGAPAADAPQHGQMALSHGCCVASVDYRLAPETPFPGAIEDCYAALVWLAANAQALDLDVQRIGVMGESAGGGLAAALAILARDRRGPHLAFQHLIYPMLDDRTCIQTDPNAFAGEFVWTDAANRFGWSALLNGEPGGTDVPAYAAPARAANLGDLPPAFISTGALDLFVEENIEYARRLLRAGVPVELRVYPGCFHGFDYDPLATVSVQARRESQAALSRALQAGAR